MRALIADDEPHLAAYLEQRLKALWPEIDICAVAHDGEAALQALDKLRPDIAFLDIRMPGRSGLDVAAHAQAAGLPCRMVFVTAYDQYAVDAFERAAVDYLLKPVSDPRLQQTIARLRQLAETPATADLRQLLAQLQTGLQTEAKAGKERLRWIKASVGANVRLIPVEEVCYFQATDKYTNVCTADGEFLIRVAIKELVEQLDPDLFWQVHRGTLVNIRQIVSAKHDANGQVTLRLKDRPESLGVSRSYSHLFKQM